MAEADNVFPGGAYQGGDDSLATMGTITVSQHGLLFEAETLKINLPMEGLGLDMDEHAERVIISHLKYPQWTLYCLDPQILYHRSLQRFGIKKKVAKLQYEHSGPTAHAVKVYKALAGLVLVLFLLWLCTPLILGLVVQAIPESWETKVGKTAFDEITEEIEISHDPALTNRLFLVTERLKKGFPANAPKFAFFVGDDEDVNAIALPGGHVIVLRGLIEEANGDELAGVLAHEVSHVLEKHGMQQLARFIGPQFILKFFFANDSALGALTAGTAILGSLHHSRKAEAQADDRAWDILEKANIDPRGLTSFFRKLKALEMPFATDTLSTHPTTDSRIESLEQRWNESLKKSGFQKVDAGPELEKK